MSVTNERISNIMNTKLSPNGTGDLQVVFGVSVMNQEWYFTTAPINKWARYKPFRTALGTAYADHYSSTNSTRLAAARLANYGLVVPNNGTARSTPAATIGDSWTYNRCVSNQHAMRAQDFEGYYHAAGAPIRYIGDIRLPLSSFKDFNFGEYIEQNLAGGDQISWEDLAAIENYYLCVVLSTGQNCTGTLYAKTASDTIGNGGVNLVITTMEQSQLRTSGYNYYYLVARSAKPSSGTWFTPSSGDAGYIALPTENGASDVMGSFTIVAANEQKIEIKRVSQLASPASAANPNFEDADSYVNAGSAYLSYANKTQPYYLCFGFDITAGSSNFTITNAAIQLSETFVSPSGYSARISCALRDPNYSSVNSYTVPAGTTRRVYFIPNAPILSLNPSGRQQTGAATGQQIEPGIEIYINNVMVDGTNFIRVSN